MAPSPPPPSRPESPGALRRPLVRSVVLFLLTFLSATAAIGYPEYAGHGLRGVLREGVPYAAALMAILLAHELGHYLAARAHAVDASLPYFIPLPFGFGTLGALIELRSPMPTRNAALDIGAAGPLAGFLVAVPVLFAGVAHSQVLPAPTFAAVNADYQTLLSILEALRDGRLHWPPEPVQVLYPNNSVITWFAAWLTHGALPAHAELRYGPLALAGWVGMVFTSLNLTPVGLLDGGHVVYAVFGRWAELVSRCFCWALLGLAIFASTNWLVWWVFARFVVGVWHPQSPDPRPLSPGRRWVAALAFAVLALTFIPVPLAF